MVADACCSSRHSSVSSVFGCGAAHSSRPPLAEAVDSARAVAEVVAADDLAPVGVATAVAPATAGEAAEYSDRVCPAVPEWEFRMVLHCR